MDNDPYGRERAPGPPKRPKQWDNVWTLLKQLFYERRHITGSRGDGGYDYWELRDWVSGPFAIINIISGLILFFVIGASVIHWSAAGVGDTQIEECKASCLALNADYVDTTEYGCFCREGGENRRLLERECEAE